jgi:predicted nucleic acid-binding protein
VLVIDANILATALADDDHDGVATRRRIFGEQLLAPDLVDLEVLSAFRQQVARGALLNRRAELAIRDLSVFPVRRLPHHPYLHRCWELRNNVTPYDACYVAIAEATTATLLTADARLARAPGLRCTIEVFAPR